MLRILDNAIQVHGGAGVSGDTPLANLYAEVRNACFLCSLFAAHCERQGEHI